MKWSFCCWLVAKSRPTLLQVSSVNGISSAWILERVAVFFSSGSFQQWTICRCTVFMTLLSTHSNKPLFCLFFAWSIFSYFLISIFLISYISLSIFSSTFPSPVFNSLSSLFGQLKGNIAITKVIERHVYFVFHGFQTLLLFYVKCWSGI